MTAKVSDYKEVLYSRDYSNDAPPQTDIAKRVALAAIPFLTLCSPLRYPVSIGMGTLRVWNADQKDILGTTVAVCALAASVFQHQVGMAITTTHDILQEIYKIQKAENWEDVSKSLIKILNNSLYLALITQGGLELSIVAFLMQAVVNLIQSRDEFKNDRWIEGVANLLMAGVRLNQSHTQYQHLTRKWEIEAAMKKIHVGQLHEEWRFPSDHLPVGVEVDGVKIISWNVLNNAYMEWVTEKDSQGLNGSIISDLDKPINDSTTLTHRDVLVAEMVQNMMHKGEVVALQECGEPFLQYLGSRIPANWGIVKSFNTPVEDQDVILYNKSRFEFSSKGSETTDSAYNSVPGRPIQNAYFVNREGKDFRIINGHIPGDPTKPARGEFAQYVREQHKDGAITVALGDNNFERHEMIDAYKKAGFTDFSLHSPWKTNIDPYTKESKGIDHLFVIGQKDSKDLKPGEVINGANLRETIDILNKPRP